MRSQSVQPRARATNISWLERLKGMCCIIDQFDRCVIDWRWRRGSRDDVEPRKEVLKLSCRQTCKGLVLRHPYSSSGEHCEGNQKRKLCHEKDGKGIGGDETVLNLSRDVKLSIEKTPS